ncbi:MAG: peptidyl-prolyl cis-trans isomerase [Myxococcota bacterium]
MKRLVLVAAMAAVACKNDNQEERREILATVSGSPIYVDELERELKRFHGGSDDDEAGLPSQTSDDAQKRAILDMLIDRRLLTRAAEAENVIVGTDDVDRGYDNLRQGWRDDEFDQLLQKKDMTTAELKAEVRELLVIRKYFHDHVYSRVAVTDAEIEGYLTKNPALNVSPEQVRARQIIVKTEEDGKRVLQELRAGKAFEEVAMRESISPEAKNGGDLGFFAHGEMPKVIDEACFKLPVNQVSPVIPSEYGFHVFKVLEHRPPAPRPIEKVRDDVEARLRKDKERDAHAAKIAELRSKSQIVVREEQLSRVI